MDVVFMVVGMLGATFSIFILAVNLIFKQGLSKKVSGVNPILFNGYDYSWYYAEDSSGQ